MQQAPENWDAPSYAIGRASEMVSLHPQTLRRYEELGLVVPARRAGRRLYSPRDIEQLRYISRLSGELGLNLAGVEVIIRLNKRIRELKAELDEMHAVCARLEERIARLLSQVDGVS